MLPPSSDEELLARQSALQAEARQVLTELDLAALFAGIGPLLLAGSGAHPGRVRGLARRPRPPRGLAPLS